MERIKSKQEAYDIFKRGVETAVALGTDKVNIVSNWPNEMRAPIDYLPCYFHPSLSSPSEPKLKMELPPGIRRCGSVGKLYGFFKGADPICEDAGIYFVLEGHANVEVGTTDAFLRGGGCDPKSEFWNELLIRLGSL